jgi:hypothetical protein
MSQGSPWKPGTVPATVNAKCMSQEPGISMYPLIFGIKVMMQTTPFLAHDPLLERGFSC